MISRRNFIRNSSVLALGGLTTMGSNAGVDSISSRPIASRPVGIQLYTVMNEIDADLDGTLKRIASIGFNELESAFSRKGGFYGLSAREFASRAKDYGLSWKAHHAIGAPFKLPAGSKPPVGADGKPLVFPPMKNLRDNGQEIIDAAAEGGIRYLVCSSTPIDTLDEIKRSIEVFQKTAEGCKKAGIGFAFHNHTKEFEVVDGKIPYDMFLSEIDGDLMKFELDLAWVTKAGTDPLELFERHPGRFPLWHIKDLDRVTQKPVEVGAGYVDLKRVFDAAEMAGLEHIFVEQDAAPKPLQNIETSYKNLAKILNEK